LSASQSAQRLSPARNRKFCRLPAGAEWIRTSGSAREWLPFCFVYLPETVRVSPKGLVRDRGFESTSLQQTVRLSSGFASIRGQSPGFQPLCGPFRAAVVGRDAQSPVASRRKGVVSLSVGIPVPQCCRTGFARLAAPAANEVELAISAGLGVRIGSSKTEQSPLILPGQRQT